ncbi:MAG TPA: hypothetical protein VKT49_14240, partial [Bryobacteraceae bacterium]|nr:hypothetical protein [Bryobacteraceae bacterium]
MRVAILLLPVCLCAAAQEPVELLQKALAGDSKAQLALGEDYRLGLGVAPNPAEALRFYKLAAEQNIPEAQFALAEMYRYGEGGPADFPE